MSEGAICLSFSSFSFESHFKMHLGFDYEIWTVGCFLTPFSVNLGLLGESLEYLLQLGKVACFKTDLFIRIF